MKIKISADSTCDLSPELIARYNIGITPLYIVRGDVAFLILLIGKLMARAGGPSLADALEVEAAKMVRRHPHVFSDTTYENQSEQLKDWDRIKREEKAAAGAEGPKGTYDSLPRGLPRAAERTLADLLYGICLNNEKTVHTQAIT